MIAGEGRHFELVRCEDESEWLEQRTHGIGGSDAASVMGVSPWKSPTILWLEKTRRKEPDDISGKPYVAFGTLMEPLVGRWFADQHPDMRVRRVNAVCRSIERPWAQASLDYEVREGGEWGVLEIKTARDSKDWEDGVPIYYLTQVYHYMSVTQRRFAHVAVFFRDTCEYASYRVDWDDEDISLLSGSIDTFWNDYVLRDVMPRVTGTASEQAALTGLFGKSNGDVLPADTPEFGALASEYMRCSVEEKRAKAAKTAAATRLMAMIGENKGMRDELYSVTWVRTNRETFDSRRFKEENPDMFARYASRKVTNGGLRVRELKG